LHQINCNRNTLEIKIRVFGMYEGAIVVFNLGRQVSDIENNKKGAILGHFRTYSKHKVTVTKVHVDKTIGEA
jgi:hypothetical protein